MFVGRVFSFLFLVVDWERVLTAARRRRCFCRLLSGVQSASFVFYVVLPPELGEGNPRRRDHSETHQRNVSEIPLGVESHRPRDTV